MDFAKDDLGRQRFADILIDLICKLAVAPTLPSGRVIAVDAPWGSGKSWLAKRLPSHFENDARIGACIYIDAFQFDYHHDPFAVIASAIIDRFTGSAVDVAQFKTAAFEVLKASIPSVAKGLIKSAAKSVGIDADEIAESFGDASEKSTEKLLDTFAATRATTEAFKERLAQLAKSGNNGAPVVVIVDELDRCRPNYALELLERVKHLFDTTNVVFLFFVHTRVLHSAIEKMYGPKIDAEGYLRKFFTISVELPVADRPGYEHSDRADFFRRFLHSQYPSESRTNRHEETFRTTLADLAPIFDISFRDIEHAMLLWQLVDNVAKSFPVQTAYALLLKVVDADQLAAIRNNPDAAYPIELERLGPKPSSESVRVSHFRDLFFIACNQLEFASNPIPNTFAEKVQGQSIYTYRENREDFERVVQSIGLEYIRL